MNNIYEISTKNRRIKDKDKGTDKDISLKQKLEKSKARKIKYALQV